MAKRSVARIDARLTSHALDAGFTTEQTPEALKKLAAFLINGCGYTEETLASLGDPKLDQIAQRFFADEMAKNADAGGGADPRSPAVKPKLLPKISRGQEPWLK